MTQPHQNVLEAEFLTADAVGDVMEHWGFKKVLGRIWAVLFLAGEALSAADIGERLQISSGAVSMSLNELSRWGVVRKIWKLGERKEFFEAETDLWKMIAKVFDERERLLGDSVRSRLERASSLLDKLPQNEVALKMNDRVKRLLSFVIMAQGALDGMIRSKQLDFRLLQDLVRFPLKALRQRKLNGKHHGSFAK